MENRKEYQYKKQGDGRDSWICTEYDSSTGEELTKYMVYEDPFKPLPINHVDITSLSDKQLRVLKEMLNALPDETEFSHRSAFKPSLDEVREKHKYVPQQPVVKKGWFLRFRQWIKSLF